MPGVLLRGSSMPSVLSIRVSKILWFVHLESLGVRSKMAALALSLTTLSRLRVVDTVAVSTCAREICVCMMYIINTVYVCVCVCVCVRVCVNISLRLPLTVSPSLSLSLSISLSLARVCLCVCVCCVCARECNCARITVGCCLRGRVFQRETSAAFVHDLDQDESCACMCVEHRVS